MVRILLLVFIIVGAVSAFAQNVLKPGDVVTLTCAEDPTLNSEYTITDQGLLLMKYIGAVEVKGLTQEQAAQKISKELVRQQVMPAATITLRLKVVAPIQAPVFVSGAVRNPGEIKFSEGMTLATALAIAEPTTVADLRSVRITRATGETGTIDFTQYQAGNIAGNPILRPGDRIFVPLKVADFQVTVLGAVVKPGIIEYSEKMTVKRAIELAGGLRSDANPKRVEITPPNSQMYIIDIEGSDTEISAGTKIVVGIREVREHVFVRGSVARPGLIPFKQGMTITDAILDAQPFAGAGLNRVRLTRRDATGKVSIEIYDIRQIQAGKSPDVLLMAEDTIDVPYASSSFRMNDTMKFIGLSLLLYFIFFRR